MGIELNKQRKTMRRTQLLGRLCRWTRTWLGASLSLSLAVFPRGVSKKGNYQLTDQQAGWGGSSLGEEFRGQKVMC